MISIWQIIIVLGSLLLVVAIARKAGYSGWWALTLLIPFVNIIVIWVFAFKEWPVAMAGGEGFGDAISLTEDEVYARVGAELEDDTKDAGLWAKAVANSEGRDALAQTNYVAYRAKAIREKDAVKVRQDAVLSKEAAVLRKQDDSRIAEESIQILKEKGYYAEARIRSGWVVHEPSGGRAKISTADELSQYAVSRESAV